MTTPTTTARRSPWIEDPPRLAEAPPAAVQNSAERGETEMVWTESIFLRDVTVEDAVGERERELDRWQG